MAYVALGDTEANSANMVLQISNLTTDVLILIVGVVTLVIVALEFYLNHVRTPISDVEIMPLQTAVTHIRSSGTVDSYQRELALLFNLNAINKGSADARLADASLQSIEFRDDSPAVTKPPSEFEIEHVGLRIPEMDGSTLRRKSSNTIGIRVIFSDMIAFEDLIAKFDEAVFSFKVEVEDNERAYDVDVTETVELAKIEESIH